MPGCAWMPELKNSENEQEISIGTLVLGSMVLDGETKGGLLGTYKNVCFSEFFWNGLSQTIRLQNELQRPQSN